MPVYNMLLTEPEKERFSQYRTTVQDGSLTKLLLDPLWDTFVKVIPEQISPNVISLAGMLCLVQAWYATYMHGDQFPQATTAFAVVMIAVFYALDAMSSKHAQRTNNDSSLSELFDHACAVIGSIFFVLTICAVFQVRHLQTIWFWVQAGQLILLHKNLGAFRKDMMAYRLLNGPGEVITITMMLMAIRFVLGAEVFDEHVQHVATTAAKAAEPYLQKMGTSILNTNAFSLEESSETSPLSSSASSPSSPSSSPVVHMNPSATNKQCAATSYAMAYTLTLLRVMYLGSEHRTTQVSLIICLVYRLIPAALFHYYSHLSWDIQPKILDIISNGLALAVITSDIVVARMAQRELHPWLILLAMTSVVSNSGVLFLAIAYYSGLFYEICQYTHLPLLTININVYCDGIYDLCHIGHMRAFQNAAKFGTRLFVGVASDEDAMPYKRQPIMTMEERCAVVGACKYVYQVIPNAPCEAGSLTEEFLKKHRIHVVACGQEYQKEGDKYYEVPRRLGILRGLPRTQGMSTSDLIGRILDRGKDGKEVKAASD